MEAWAAALAEMEVTAETEETVAVEVEETAVAAECRNRLPGKMRNQLCMAQNIEYAVKESIDGRTSDRIKRHL